ncbi:MAG TPA: glycosyltransferase [Thermoanaerobaculia bacterium]|nr:glycosyltransferase [Thermoanaerobaculia bacterium]
MKVCYFLSHYPSHRIAGEQYMSCMRAAGIELVESPRDADAVVIHNESQHIPGYFRMHPELRDRRVIAYSVWETDQLPPHYRFNLGLVSELWTSSRYCRDVLVQAGRPVSIVPHVVTAPPRDDAAVAKMRDRIGAHDGQYVFYTINVMAYVRKGVDEIVRAFREEFPNGEARLVVKGAGLPRPLAATPGVVAIPEHLPANELHALHYAADCYVSAHHAEGWGLTLSDAMAAGRLVIATAYSGNMDFMNATNSLPVACSVEPIRARDLMMQPELLSPEMRWAYADPADLRRQMRRAYEERASLHTLGEQAQRDMAAFAPARIADILMERLQCS